MRLIDETVSTFGHRILLMDRQTRNCIFFPFISHRMRRPFVSGRDSDLGSGIHILL